MKYKKIIVLFLAFILIFSQISAYAITSKDVKKQIEDNYKISIRIPDKALNETSEEDMLFFYKSLQASFRNIGEQIDGAFTLDGTDYLFEAKWQEYPTNASDLDAFAGKISRKLDNTLGLFLSINGYSEEAVKIHSRGRSTILLMDGTDLMAVLEGRIDFVTLLIRKRRHAAQTGNIYFRILDDIY